MPTILLSVVRLWKTILIPSLIPEMKKPLSFEESGFFVGPIAIALYEDAADSGDRCFRSFQFVESPKARNYRRVKGSASAAHKARTLHALIKQQSIASAQPRI